MKLIIILALFLASEACGREIHVASAQELDSLASSFRAGDQIILRNGVWTDQTLRVQARGTERKPIVLRAETPGKVVLNGRSSLTVEGEQVVVSGLLFRDGKEATNGILLAGRRCRLTETAVVDSAYKFFVRLSGEENRVDHCYLAGKRSESPTLQIEVGAKPNRHRLDHNHFGPRPPLGRNGGETIRVGYSWQSMSNSSAVVEQNLFERCDGEIEIISNKSCNNVYRANTFLDCAGMLTLRHGNGCWVEGNFFIGHHKRGSGGIRIIGENHTIINNYIEGVVQGGFWVTAGIENSPLKGYFQAKNIVIAFNTMVDSRGACVDLSAGLGGAGRTLLPENVTLANNLFVMPVGSSLGKGREGNRFRWLGNMAWWESPPEQGGQKGVVATDPHLVRGVDGLWRPAPGSPVRQRADGAVKVKTDVDGQARPRRADVGCDQVSEGRVIYRPLKRQDVGPAWMIER